jgi:hypothetical protein
MRSRKNIALPGRLLGSVAVDPQSSSDLPAVDKSQVFALSLNRGKFAKNPNHWIQHKFSIDGDLPQDCGAPGPATISKPYCGGAGNPTFTIYAE